MIFHAVSPSGKAMGLRLFEMRHSSGSPNEADWILAGSRNSAVYPNGTAFDKDNIHNVWFGKKVSH